MNKAILTACLSLLIFQSPALSANKGKATNPPSKIASSKSTSTAARGTWIVPDCAETKKPKQNVLFEYVRDSACEPGKVGGAWLQPICVIDGNKITNVPEVTVLDDQQNTAPSPLLKEGSQYSVYFAGKPSGTVTSTKLERMDYQTSLSCKHGLAGKLPANGGLATSNAIAPVKGKVSALKPAETKRIKAYLQSVLQNSGCPKQVAGKLTFSRLLKLENVKSSEAITIASVEAVENKANQSPISHCVFLVASDVGGKVKPLIKSITHHKDELSEENTGREIFLDQLDINNDGIPELITRRDFAGSSDFRIYTMKNKKWTCLGSFGSYGPGC